jgi:hypothetical protein
VLYNPRTTGYPGTGRWNMAPTLGQGGHGKAGLGAKTRRAGAPRAPGDPEGAEGVSEASHQIILYKSSGYLL